MNEEGQTVLTLDQPLQYQYERASVTIHANVVQATHGETVDAEVLGSGDGMQAQQQFVLKETPLTYVPPATPDDTGSTLRVRVNDMQWDEARTLYNLPAPSRSYQVRQDAAGHTTLTFGDGVYGARLPSGSENVVATYRRGLGPEGNVLAHSLTLLQTRPLGVQSVTNPLPARGGIAPEDGDQARQRAPWSVVSLDRIVALADFEAFARAFPGIGLAQATLLHLPQGQVVHITIADSNGATVPESSALYTSLAKALNQRRNPLQPMRLDSYTPVPIELTARLDVDSRYRPEAVKSAVQSALQHTFGFGQRAFGQPLASAEVVQVIQQVPGVVAVVMQKLARQDGKTAVEAEPMDRCASYVPADRAYWDWDETKTKTAIVPAELLQLTMLHTEVS